MPAHPWFNYLARDIPLFQVLTLMMFSGHISLHHFVKYFFYESKTYIIYLEIIILSTLIIFTKGKKVDVVSLTTLS